MYALISLPVLMVILAGLFLAVLGLRYKMAAVDRCRPMAFSAGFLLSLAVLVLAVLREPLQQWLR